MRTSSYVYMFLSLGSCIGGGYTWDANRHGISVALFGICMFTLSAAIGYGIRADKLEGKE